MDGGGGAQRVMVWLVQRPVRLWVVYLGVLMLIGVAAKAVWPELMAGAQGLGPVQVGVQAILTLLPLPLVWAFGWRRAGFTRPTRWALLLFPLATVAFAYTGQWRSVPWHTAVLAIILVLLVALGEETMFRGVLLGALLPHGTASAVAISSALFGLVHVVNLVLGAPPAGVMLQVLFAGMGGAGFAAVRLRTGSLWPAMGLHAAYDLSFRLIVIEPGTPFANTVYMLHGVGLLIYAIVVLRRHTGEVADAATPAPSVTSAAAPSPDAAIQPT